MSLFKVCSQWSTQCSDLEDNYDVATLLCARFGLLDHEKDYVIVGSQAGHLSIFYPNPGWELNENAGVFQATDLLLETKLKNSILGVYCGKFSGNTRNENANQLAILHPNSLAIYNLQTIDGVAEHGTQASLHLHIEHTFQRAAFSFCFGHFGQVKGREFYCIVHLDGTLTFYEQDGISYECHFPGHRPLPSPVVYCERTDSFFRFGATWTLECYTYQDLSHSSINRSHYQPVWTVCLGEGILDMVVVQAKETTASIVILGERNFICLNDSGKIEFILKLDYSPKCFFSFVAGYYWEPNARMITAIISESSKLYIYEDANIIWAARLQEEPPVAIKRSNLNNLPGGIVTLGETGKLTIGYLGSESFNFTVPPLNVQEMNFQQAYKELVQLEDEIKESIDMSDRDLVNQRALEDIKINFTIDSLISTDFDGLLLDVPADVAVLELPACKGIFKFKCKICVSELQVSFNMPEGVRCTQDTITYIDLEAGVSKSIELDFYVAELLHVHTTKVDVMVSFINTQGIPRVIQRAAYLPLEMFFKPMLPQKSASIKLTFNIESKTLAPKLTTFFPEFMNEQSDVNALGLVLLWSGNGKEEVVTIVAAKNSSRIRVQSDNLETLPLIIERLLNTAKTHEKLKAAENKFVPRKLNSVLSSTAQIIRATAAIPSQEILHVIDVHRETQENIKRQSILMDDLWKQFKTLQRKLQEKSENEPKESLVMQIEQNYDNLIAEGDKLMEMRIKEKRQGCDLSGSIALSNMIIECLPIEEKIVNIVSAVLCTPIEDWTELSWEESMLPGIDMLHHYGPLNRSHTNADNNTTEANNSQELFDYNRFRRHFATLFERIVKLATMEVVVQPAEKEALGKPTAPGLNFNQPTIDASNFVMDDGVTRSKSRSTERNTRGFTLEAVEDDEDEYDEDDLKKNKNKLDSTEQKSENETSEWVNDNFELPSSEELFNDLGIWW